MGLLRPWCDTACPIRYTNTGTRLFPCGRTASICTHHYNDGPSVKAPAFLISGILSGKFVASGQQQKVRGVFADPDHDKHNNVPQCTSSVTFVGSELHCQMVKTVKCNKSPVYKRVKHSRFLCFIKISLWILQKSNL